MRALDELIAQGRLKIRTALMIVTNACLGLQAKDGSGWVGSAAVTSIDDAPVCMWTPG